VFLEGAEFIEHETGKLREEVVRDVATRVDSSRLMFELPGVWIPNVRPCDIHEMTVVLLDTFGPEANIANVMPQWVVELETLRTGVGVSGV
jgi:phosphosulfolactate synthase